LEIKRWLLTCCSYWIYVYVSGTTATDDENARTIIGIGDPYTQTIQAIKNIEKALEMAGATLKDVVRTRICVTNIDHWDDVGKTHAHFFKEIRPATTTVEVSRLISDEMLVDVETEALIIDSR
jgi:enamine deaminase RidA (YjgF/YER057c/UK114 family)